MEHLDDNPFSAIPFGQVPALEYDGTLLVQSNSIAKFLAREYNLAGKTKIEIQQSEAYVDHYEDLLQSMS